MCTIQMKSLLLIIFEIFDKKSIWPFDFGSRSKVMAPNERPCMISYMSTIQMKPLSHVFFEIFETIACLTFDLGSRSNFMAPKESPYMIFYMSTIQMETLSLIVFEKSADFTMELWTLTSRGQTPHPISIIFNRLLEGAIVDMYPKNEFLLQKL